MFLTKFPNFSQLSHFLTYCWWKLYTFNMTIFYCYLKTDVYQSCFMWNWFKLEKKSKYINYCCLILERITKNLDEIHQVKNSAFIVFDWHISKKNSLRSKLGPVRVLIRISLTLRRVIVGLSAYSLCSICDLIMTRMYRTEISMNLKRM